MAGTRPSCRHRLNRFRGGGSVFDIDAFVQECLDARSEASPAVAVRETVERVVRDRAASSVFTPDRSAFEVLHRSDELTVIHIALAPRMRSTTHDHTMWAVVGILDGQEDNAFFRDGTDGGLVPSGGRSLEPGETLAMGTDTIHHIRNPRDRYLSALHVYGGDLLGTERREWDADGSSPRPHDNDAPIRMAALARAEEDRLGRGLTGDEVDAFTAALRR